MIGRNLPGSSSPISCLQPAPHQCWRKPQDTEQHTPNLPRPSCNAQGQGTERASPLLLGTPVGTSIASSCSPAGCSPLFWGESSFSQVLWGFTLTDTACSLSLPGGLLPELPTEANRCRLGRRGATRAEPALSQRASRAGRWVCTPAR